MGEAPRFQLLRAAERGRIDSGWQELRCHFNFDDYRNPARAGLGGLLALNVHRLKGGGVVDALPTANACVFLWIRSGALIYRDNTPLDAELEAGGALCACAGSGLVFGLANASSLEAAEYFTFWFSSRLRDGDPRADLRKAPEPPERNAFRLLAAPDERDGALWVNQDALLACADLDAGRTLAWELAEENFLDRGPLRRRALYLVVMEGRLRVSARTTAERPSRQAPLVLEVGDGLAVEDASVIHATAEQDASFALVETALHAE